MTSVRSRAFQAAFWLLAAVFYIWYFGRSVESYVQILHVAIPLLLVAMAAAWILGDVLLPRYLLGGARWKFALYATYTLVVSAYLVLGIIVADFMWADFDVAGMTPATLDRAGLFVGVYVVVATALVIRMVDHWEDLSAQNRQAVADKALVEERLKKLTHDPDQVLEIQVDRRTHRLNPRQITHLESAGDYVLVHTDAEKLITKARLGVLAARLTPAGFLQVHRGFVVRPGAVEAWSPTSLTIGSATIPVSRSHRQAVRTTFGPRESGDQEST